MAGAEVTAATERRPFPRPDGEPVNVEFTVLALPSPADKIPPPGVRHPDAWKQVKIHELQKFGLPLAVISLLVSVGIAVISDICVVASRAALDRHQGHRRVRAGQIENALEGFWAAEQHRQAADASQAELGSITASEAETGCPVSHVGGSPQRASDEEDRNGHQEACTRTLPRGMRRSLADPNEERQVSLRQLADCLRREAKQNRMSLMGRWHNARFSQAQIPS